MKKYKVYIWLNTPAADRRPTDEDDIESCDVRKEIECEPEELYCKALDALDHDTYQDLVDEYEELEVLEQACYDIIADADWSDGSPFIYAIFNETDQEWEVGDQNLVDEVLRAGEDIDEDDDWDWDEEDDIYEKHYDQARSNGMSPDEAEEYAYEQTNATTGLDYARDRKDEDLEEDVNISINKDEITINDGEEDVALIPTPDEEEDLYEDLSDDEWDAEVRDMLIKGGYFAEDDLESVKYVGDDATGYFEIKTKDGETYKYDYVGLGRFDYHDDKKFRESADLDEEYLDDGEYIDKFAVEGKWTCVYTSGDNRELPFKKEEYLVKTFDTEEEANEFAENMIKETSDVYGHNFVSIFDPDCEEVKTLTEDIDDEVAPEDEADDLINQMIENGIDVNDRNAVKVYMSSEGWDDDQITGALDYMDSKGYFDEEDLDLDDEDQDFELNFDTVREELLRLKAEDSLITEDEIDDLAQKVLHVLEREQMEIGEDYESVEELDLVGLFDSSTDSIHDLGYKLMSGDED